MADEESCGDDGLPQPPPAGSRAPPNEFLKKMQWIDRYQPTTQSERSSFGMFDQPLFTYNDFPSSLHFAEHSISIGSGPSSHAREALSILHARYLGNAFGTKQGYYGAGGGGVHVLYLARPPPASASASAFPDIAVLLDMLHLSDAYRPSSMRWMTTADPIHQQLFPKYRDDDEAVEEASVLSLDVLMDLLASTGTMPATRRILAPDRIPLHVTANYPSLVHGRILFLLPRFSSVHDGDCLRNDRPVDAALCPTAAAFRRLRQPSSEPWNRFQARTENNAGVFWEETAGTAKEPGDVYESPVLCLFQLKATGEILALAQWDYRD